MEPVTSAMVAYYENDYDDTPLYSALLRPGDAIILSDFIEDINANGYLSIIELFAAIPYFSPNSYGPLIALSFLLTTQDAAWPVFQLQQVYTKCWKLLPEEAKAGYASPLGTQFLETVHEQCKRSYSSLHDLLYSYSDANAIIDPETKQSLRHRELAACVASFRLPLTTAAGRRKPVVAVSLPNGPLLALSVLATATYFTAAPIAHGSGVGAEQFRVDVLQSRADMILTTAVDVDRLRLRDPWLEEAGIAVCLVELSASMHLTVASMEGDPMARSLSSRSPTPNGPDDTGILLFTSGTSGTKKLVPLSIHSMVCGIAMVIQSWGLSPSMRCLNQMPLNHVGGLIRNLFAPIMSGGSVICCSAFDANLFWDCVEDFAPTWYYASPSMHQCILEAGIERPESMAQSRIHLVCNAAGGLLPSLACQLRDTFSTETTACTILPSYGMTECMPISTPPLDYRLQKTGTSGISVGPEIAILNNNQQHENTGVVGRICVRGPPVFTGYLKADHTVDTSCFDSSRFFDTGDLGYLDTDSYLYITGRSKEVINRGGELISPFEVEEAVVAASALHGSRVFGRISKALAFSVMHDVLQEVVGVVITTPEGAHRASLADIQDSLKGNLGQVKIPVVVVYMDGGVPTNNNKVLRIRLAERLGLPQISDSSSQAERYYEALCPPVNTSLGTTIPCSLLQTSHDELRAACKLAIPTAYDVHVRRDASDFYQELLIAPNPDPRTHHTVHSFSSSEAATLLAEAVHGYNAPSRIIVLDQPFQRTSSGHVDEKALSNVASLQLPTSAVGNLTATESTVALLFSQVLGVPIGDIGPSSDFFDLGGSSMAAGQLLSKLRKAFSLRLPIDVLFNNREVSGLAALLDERVGMSTSEVSSSTDSSSAVVQDRPVLLPGCEETYSSTRISLMILQLLPMGLIYPMKRAFTWTVFMYFLTFTQRWPTNETLPGRLIDLVISMAVGQAVTRIVAPLLGIAVKWSVIGRYKQGIYPMWSSYHTKWWICQKTIAVTGIGMFGTSNRTRVWYFRMLGTTIGKNVSIAKGTKFGEYDLLNIGDGAVLERCIVRPFAAERNTSMYLGRINVGAKCSIGLGSIVAAGSDLAPGTCIGPNSSSWEAADADEANRHLAANSIPVPHWSLVFFAAFPFMFIVTFCGAIPWLGGLVALVLHEPNSSIVDMLRQVVIWFASPQRVGYHYLALSLNAALGPIFFFVAVIAVKNVLDLCCGSLTPNMAANRSNIEKFRLQLMRDLMPTPQFCKISGLFGSHYDATSVFARALGAKIGKRVYWPGTGPSIQDFPLIEIGDDVVFGSRSHLVTSDGTSSEPVRIESGTMIADRVVVLPGVTIGRKAVMGSGALTKRGQHYAAETTWVGSSKGNAICLTATATESKPSVAPKSLTRMSSFSDTRMSRRPSSTSDIDLDYLAPPMPRVPYTSHSMNSSGTTLVRPTDSETSTLAPRRHGALTIHADSSEVAMLGRVYSGDETAFTAAYNKSLKKTPSVTVTPAGAKKPIASTTPFGRAFYDGAAPYRVWGQSTIFFYSTAITVITSVFWNIGSITAVQIVARAFKSNSILTDHFLANTWYRPFSLYIYFSALLIGIMAAQTIFIIAVTIAAKWILMGRRKPGNYDWDKSSYCQRWQLFLKLESLRRHCYNGHGILGMLTGTHWLVLYFRALGATIGKDCALFAGGLPSLMLTEPDLLTLGDRVAVDDASLVGHINTRGKFDLNPLYVGDRSVLRSGSRLLSGARMEADTCLLEHTLVMGGDVVDAGCTSQGWPAEDYKGSRVPTLKPKLVWGVD